MTRGNQVLNTKPTVSLKKANHKTVCFVYKGIETSQTSSSLPGTKCLLCNSENLTKGGSPTPTKLWCVRSLLRGTEPSQTQRQAGTFIEPCPRGRPWSSQPNFRHFKGLLSQHASASELRRDMVDLALS
ncbi:hypothetical protein Pyn_27871 [Prunus yedoensis var. nudiflora]|uniref:Uncharacterized protein n=1 Tax=Prunus yedoensis var. nudiflora TaxID=2094558 RepID=A0A314ZEY8_PRUYE|nr:hypothetical protein Pyn_27871 [Prunus yedoensis var. nudiflora]